MASTPGRELRVPGSDNLERMTEASFSLGATIRRLAGERPDDPAFVTSEETQSFAQFDARSSRVAAALHAAGVGRGDRIAVLLRNGAPFLEVAFGASKAGATLVALNWRLAAPEIGAILADARPAALVCAPELADRVPDRADRPRQMNVLALGAAYDAWLDATAAEDPLVAVAPGDVALVLYSSGTTGRPKGVMLTNENLSYIPRMARDLFRMTPESVHLVVAPLFHIGGAATGLTTTTLGGRTIVPRDADPEAILDAIERERVTHAFFVPAVIARLVASLRERPRDIASLRYVAYGAAPMTETLLRDAIDALGCGFIGCYGMTETSATVTMLAPEEHRVSGPEAARLRSIGRQLPWHTVRVTDLDTGEQAPVGQVGEIWVRSPMNMAGYLNQPEATAETLRDDGWLRTGDGAYRDADGYLYLTDRLKDMIITGGENVYPAEVENVLAAHPDVADVAVIGLPDPRWGETVTAIVAAPPGTQPEPAALIAFTRERLAHYKCPTSVRLVAELPRNPSGKVIKRMLRELFAPEPAVEARD